MRKRVYKKGQTLIEIAVALGISTIVIVALVILAASGLRNAQDTIRRTESNKMANAGIEAVIYYKNAFGFNSATNFPQEIGEAGKYCYNMLDSGSSTSLDKIPDCSLNDGYVTVYSPTTNLSYDRKITVVKDGPNTYTVYSTVNWTVVGNKENSVSVKRVLTNWK